MIPKTAFRSTRTRVISTGVGSVEGIFGRTHGVERSRVCEWALHKIFPAGDGISPLRTAPTCARERCSGRDDPSVLKGFSGMIPSLSSWRASGLRILCSLLVAAALFHRSAAAAPEDAALKKAGEFLMAQQEESGAFSEHKRNARNLNAMTSLAILALTSMGHQPTDETPEGRSLKRGLDYILRPDGQDDDGYFGGKDGSRMYGHGITTLMLAEMIGMGADSGQDELLRTKCRKAIELILRAQKVPKSDNNRGGWRYTPESGDSDMSVTVWQTMALRAAKNAGMDVPHDAIEQAVKYIKRCFEPERDRKRGEQEGKVDFGGFGYQGRGRELSTTAEGLLALQVCGEYEAEETLAASNRLLRDGIRPGEKWFFYLTYYYAQGMYQRGGQHADEGRKVTANVLLPVQQRDGSWEGTGGEERQGGKIYATSLAVLALAVKNHYLPIYQR